MLINSLSLIIFYYLFRTVSASTHHSNCTIPAKSVNFVSSPNVRGTLDILWSSLFTLFICTWTVQHLNVPRQRVKPLGWWEAVLPKLKWMTITILIPEFLVARSAVEWMAARKQCKKMQDLCADGQEWTLTHAFFANMGGFVLQVRQPEPLVQPATPDEPKSSFTKPDLLKTTTKESDLEIAMVKLAPTTAGRSGGAISSDIDPPLIYLHGAQLEWLCRHQNTPLSLPKISKAQLEDMSKGDFFVKGTAVIQVMWLFITILVRVGKKLPIAQLELAVLAFAVCSIIAYLFFWSKPQDVKVAIPLYIDGPLSSSASQEISRADYCGEPVWSSLYSLSQEIEIRSLFDPIANDVYPLDLVWAAYPHIYTFSIAAGVLFGSLHCVAWNFHFPTEIERIIWRSASVFVTVSPPICISIWILINWTLNWSYSLSERATVLLYQGLIQLSSVLYVIARLFIMVELFRSLLFLEPEAFVATWSMSVPHIG